MSTTATVRNSPAAASTAASPHGALQRQLLCAAREEADADLSQLLLGMVRLVDRRTPARLRSDVLAEMLSTVTMLAFRDELTGVLNRRGFLRQGTELLRRAASSGQRATLFYADVNFLKQLNDTVGHAAGDALLVRVGAILGAVFRRGDVVGRLGGDEFAGLALIPNDRSDRWLQQRLAEALRRANAEPGHPQVSLSIGIASCGPSVPLSLQELMGQADRAMYANKQRRRQDRTFI